MSKSTHETAAFIIENRDRIKWAMIRCIFSACLVVPYAASTVIHMRRIEGRLPILAVTEFGSGAIFPLEFIDRRRRPFFPRWLGYYNL